MNHRKLLSAAVLILLAASPAQAAWTKLEVFPPQIELTTAADRQSLVVVATADDGVTRDVTAEAVLALPENGPARLAEQTLYPSADGETTLTVEYEGLSCQAPVKVAQATVERGISFKIDVMPVFMRAGCNTGSCHGQKRGKDGFELSLFGYDPDSDHHRITREMGARRINMAVPAESLLLEKSTGAVQHSGGKRFGVDSEYHATILRWLEAGVPKDPADAPTVTNVEIYPPKVVLQGEGAAQQFIARATYSDGTSRDITDLAVFLTNNDNSAPITADGLAAAAARGEAFVMARFNTFTVGSQVLVLPADLKYTQPSEQPVNYVDELVADKLHKIRVEPSGLCSDEVFLRRITIDVTGKLPTPEEYAAFIANPAPDKRAKLIDELLGRKEFAEIWAMKWAELLMIKSSNQVAYKPMFLYSTWLTGEIANNVPLNEIVIKLLGANGGTFSTPATNFYQMERDNQKVAENVAQVFMGMRIQCAQCHNHPFDRWTMDDYYGFTAFFSQIGRKTGEDYRETIVYNRGGGEVNHPVGGRVMAPKFLGGAAPDTKGKDRRVMLAEWLASPENPYFARNVANRIWEHFFGIGIVEPVDDIRVSNPASNPELLTKLGEKLTEYDYDFKRLVRDICNSNTYQRTTEANASNETDNLNFARARLRRIKAECLLDCISQATETKDKFRGLPIGARAVQIADGRTSNYFLTTFGRSPRETVCACEASTDPTLSQALHLLNGTTVQSKIRQGGVAARLLKEEKSPEEIITALYVTALARKPTPEEVEGLRRLIEEEENKQVAVEDTFWALLNSREFIFNH